MRVRYTPRARGDLRMIIEYLVERNPVGAQNVKRAMERTVELIGQFPESGRRVSEHGVAYCRSAGIRT